VCTAGNALRQKANIGVRQPLNKLEVKNLNLEKKYVELIKDELNIKEILESKNIEVDIKLDTNVTPALKAEGEYREFMRELQDERKKLGLNPGDKMSMDILKVYKKYKIMPNLQMHMLRVAGVATLICDNFETTLPKKEIITACLLHDMGNIIKFDLNVFPEFSKPEGVEYWQSVKDEYVEKYGNDEHKATIDIAKEIQSGERIIELINSVSFLGAPGLVTDTDFAKKIVEYCDVRVDPVGVVSLEGRFMDLRRRYGHKGGDTPERRAFEVSLQEIEKQIFAKCKIKPEDINDQRVVPIIEELKKFVIE
jgi:hypothetical protein